MNAHQIVEAVLFASDAPLTADEIARADETLDEDQVEQAIEFLTAEYGDADRSFQIVEVGEGYQILTRPEFAPYLERFDNVPRPSRLSGPALETLAIIAYRQPLGRVEMEYIRGVGSSGVIRTLQDRQMIDVVGRGEGLGRPLLYGTTQQFLEHFGFKSLESLPRPEELPVILRDRVPLGPPEEPDDQEELALDGEAAAGESGEVPGTEESEDGEAQVDAAGSAETTEAVDAEADNWDEDAVNDVDAADDEWDEDAENDVDADDEWDEGAGSEIDDGAAHDDDYDGVTPEDHALEGEEVAEDDAAEGDEVPEDAADIEAAPSEPLDPRVDEDVDPRNS